jgi:hypothetical protein
MPNYMSVAEYCENIVETFPPESVAGKIAREFEQVRSFLDNQLPYQDIQDMKAEHIILNEIIDTYYSDRLASHIDETFTLHFDIQCNSLQRQAQIYDKIASILGVKMGKEYSSYNEVYSTFEDITALIRHFPKNGDTVIVTIVQTSKPSESKYEYTRSVLINQMEQEVAYI